jgi:serine/threonine-protein kinase RsbW
MPPTAEIELRILNRLEALSEAAKQLFCWMDDLAISTRARYSVMLSVEEMVTNIIKYGFDEEAEHFIRVKISVDRALVKIVFEDEGHPFDPTRQPAPDIETLVESRKTGGLGIELVRRMCEKMSYVRTGRLNRLTLQIRRLQPDDTQVIAAAEA